MPSGRLPGLTAWATPSLISFTVYHGAAITLLGNRHLLSWERTSAGIRVHLPEAPDEQAALVLRISPASTVSPADADKEAS
ncbi:hypothetical protein ITP53_37220 [Nonomuraea sp. K274]|uniref:Uncharacterized protein n=1 Tax=Nonomuraea cypriaca TaxID=1187855 RepID=A0A931AIZ9_9ACTN|nr:hypothetical protein [Nonomuraea cypriaca]MBF8191249.1 hypothetical protein [Nonomuraea cypriaca]